MSLPLVVFHPAFFSAFQYPRLIAMAVAVLGGSLWLLPRAEWRVPVGRDLRFAGAWLVLGALLGLRGPTPWTAAVAFGLLGTCFAGWLVAAQLPDAGRRGVLVGILAAAVLESCVAIAHVLHPLELLRPFDDAVRPAAIGTVGNAEFLATLLAAGLCVAWHVRLRVRDRIVRLMLAASAAPLVVALLMTRSKGTLALLVLAALYGWKGWKPVVAVGVVSGIAAPLLFPDSVLGRVMLWTTTGKVLLDGLPFGSGFAGLTHRYLDTVCGLFSSHPALSGRLGTYIGDVRDAHNLVLDQGIALGAAGVALSVLFLIHIVRRGISVGGGLGAALLILAAKTSYTVVLGSATGGWLLALLLAVTEPAAGWRRARIHPGLRPAFPVAICGLTLLVLPALRADLAYQAGIRSLYRGSPEAARVSFDEALRSDPGHAESVLSLAFLAFREGDHPTMKALVGKAIVLEPTIDIVKRGAHMFFFSRMYPEAEPLYRRLMLAYPDRRSAIIKLAQVRLALGDRREAESLARQVIAMQPRVYNANDTEYVRTARDLVAGVRPRSAGHPGSAILNPR